MRGALRASSTRRRASSSGRLILLLPKGSGTETHQQATLTERGKPIYEGTFSASGEFENARLIGGDRVRYVEVLHATAVGRKLVVVTREATLSSDGKEGQARPVSILAQADLGPGYLEAMVRDQRSSRLRMGLTLGEMKRILGPDDAANVARVLLASNEFVYVD